MSLQDTVEKLQKQEANGYIKPPWDWVPSNDIDEDLIITLRNAAAALLRVLGCFEKGDADALGKIIDDYCLKGDTNMDLLRRLQEACRLMETNP